MFQYLSIYREFVLYLKVLDSNLFSELRYSYDTLKQCGIPGVMGDQ